MTPLQLPEGFECLVSDRPLLDLYAGRPWPWPDELTVDLRHRIRDLVADERSTRLILHEGPRQFRRPVAAIVPELDQLIGFLFGTGAVRLGAWALPELALLAPWRTTRPAMFGGLTWSATGSSWRPPSGGWLARAAGSDPVLRQEGLSLLIDGVRALAGITPVEPRRLALLALLEQAGAGPVDGWLHASYPRDRSLVEDLWAASAGGSVLAVLPELTGPAGYFGWAFAEWREVHERLASKVSGGQGTLDAFICLARVAGVPGPPTSSPESWRATTLHWLGNGLLEGRLEDCRLWIDRSIRLSQALAGLPGPPRTVENQFIPVVAFHRQVRSLFDHRDVPEPVGAVPYGGE